VSDRLAEIRARLDAWREDADATEADIYAYVSANDIAWLLDEVGRLRGCTWCCGEPVDTTHTPEFPDA
jgi:hypothetical protein